MRISEFVYLHDKELTKNISHELTADFMHLI